MGGGAILFDILNKFDLKEVYISDINSELVNTYITIRDDIDILMNAKHIIRITYKRNNFNELKISNDRSVNIQKAALTIFLNKTCFNGLYRVNKKVCLTYLWEHIKIL